MAATKHVQTDDLTAAERARLLQGTRRSPRFLIIGGGQRGSAYASAIIREKHNGVIHAVAEPLEPKRKAFGRKYIWLNGPPGEDQEFDSWQMFIKYETSRREREAAGERVRPGVDGVFVCTLDRTHTEILKALAPLKLHVMCEKPLATSLQECKEIYMSVASGTSGTPEVLFSIGHVLRYSPHNILLRKLLLEDRAIGEIISIEHTEPVGWWHFSHSYVRGNWRKESISAPSLLCKSCHDIDFLLWLMCYKSDVGERPHMPSLLSSTGNLAHFTKRRKPKAAGSATNCFACKFEPDCSYSAKKIYLERQFDKGNLGWPNDVVAPDIETIASQAGSEHARGILSQALSADYDASTPQDKVDARPWYGRCVWECDNDVLDDQIVTMTWDDDPIESNGKAALDRGPKTALFHMIAFTEKQCERRGKISGTHGEIEYDSSQIRVYEFAGGTSKTYTPPVPGGGHGGGDGGLAGQYVKAVDAVINEDMPVQEAQVKHIGCTFEEAFMSHAMVFAAEQARTHRSVVDWPQWWGSLLREMRA